jgi:cation transport protein ChaC
VAVANVADVVAYLRARELIYGVYREAMLPVRLGAGASTPATLALAYTVERAHPSYNGGLGLARQARIIRAARGQSGANLDYLINTVRHLEALGIRERRLERLMALAAGHVANEPLPLSTNGARPGAAGLRRASLATTRAELTVPPGDQRRFGHRQRLWAT